jgi:hypothetical protein
MSIIGARGVRMDQQQAPTNQITVFYSYAHADERLRKQLETHLGLLRQQGIIATWHDRQIVAGTDWAQELDTHLSTAAVILLLISPDFLASDYCYGVELRKALERDAAGEARVIPILLRPVADWDTAPFARLAVLPTNRKPITRWRHRDEAWTDVAGGIRRAIEHLQATAGSFPPSSLHSTARERPESRTTALSRHPGTHSPIPGTQADAPPQPGGTIEARGIHATNVVSGTQYIGQQTIYQVAGHLSLPADASSSRPFMAADLPPGFVPRPHEFAALKASLLHGSRDRPTAITSALLGPGTLP